MSTAGEPSPFNWHCGQAKQHEEHRIKGDGYYGPEGYICTGAPQKPSVVEAVLQLWDDNDAWIPGADYARLAEVLGVPAERLLPVRHGGRSQRSAGAFDRNIPLSMPEGLLVALADLREGDTFTVDNDCTVPLGATIHHTVRLDEDTIAVIDRNGYELLTDDADRKVRVAR